MSKRIGLCCGNLLWFWLLCFVLIAPVKAAQEATQNAEQWRADLRFLAAETPRRHLNAFHTISAENWAEEVAALDADIPSLPDHVIVVRLTRLLVLIGDGHTSLSWTSARYAFRRYPVFFTNRPDGVFVTRIINEPKITNRGYVHYGRILGTRLVRIGGLEIEQVKQRLLSLIATDNEYGPSYFYPNLLNIPEVLHALGVVADQARGLFRVEDGEGRRFELELAPVTSSESAQLAYFAWPDVRRWTRPLFFTRPATELYWYEYLPEQRAVYFRYSQCAEMPNLSFATFAQDLLRFLDTNYVQRLIIELRGNPGGNSAIFEPFIEAVRTRPRFNQRGRLFVLIDNGVFSSGMMAANSLQLRTNAILIGEPTGGKPNSYGEVLSFTLPHSGLTVRHSTKYFTRRPLENLAAIMPDLFVQFPWAAYQAGNDPVLEAALNY